MIGPQSESGPFYLVHFPSNLIRNLQKTFKAFSSSVINLLLSKLVRDQNGGILALALFCVDLTVLGAYCQDLGPIFSQYGPRARLIRYIDIIAGSHNTGGVRLYAMMVADNLNGFWDMYLTFLQILQVLKASPPQKGLMQDYIRCSKFTT